ncbi:hypothetical protein [Flavobacterium sp. N2038]|uniref:hypothetical protein n=1 Tax=Flavobacterium sp. N2038 TaxID=2986829 RepID=UPI002225800A|nr:hypothetical protein [Flavobacterium sp. N2038]
MKKLLLLFTVLSLIVSSCSSDENPPLEPKDSTLPKTIISIYPGFSSDTALVSYDDMKIKSIAYKKYKVYYYYEENLINRKAYYNIVEGKEVKVNEETYAYTKGKLASIKYLDIFTSTYPKKINIRSVYTYLADTLIKEQRFSTDYLTKIETEEDYFSLLTVKNGNRIKEVVVNTKTNIPSYGLRYVYDNMNSPFKNIIGMSLLINDEKSSLNNRLSRSSADSGTYFDIKKYEYDPNGYPNLETYYKGEGGQITNITKYLY